MPEKMTELRNLEEKLGYHYKDRTLLERALTHSSYANENKKRNIADNERLEFLGDSIVGMEVARYLYLTFPQLKEGQMTRMRAELVCESGLAAIGEEIGLGDYLLLGKGEDAGGGRRRHSIVSDAFEAVIASAYLDGGAAVAHDIVSRLVISRITAPDVMSERDYKTELQEVLQTNPQNKFSYENAGESGPDHDKRFTVNLIVNGEIAGTGTGRSKKAAEQIAAQAALEKYHKCRQEER